MDGRESGRRSGELAVPFIFVPHGEEPPAEWLVAHPRAVRFPARFVPRGDGESGRDAPQAAVADGQPVVRNGNDEGPRPEQARSLSAQAGIDVAPPPKSAARAPAPAGSGAVTRHTIRAGTGLGQMPEPPRAPSDYAARLAAATTTRNLAGSLFNENEGN